MFILGVVSTIISMFFPFAGVLFILAISGKYQRKFKGFIFFTSFAVSAIVFKASGLIDSITLFDLILGIGAPSIFYLFWLEKSGDQMKSLLNCILLVIVYALLRTLFFHDAFIVLINQAMEQNRQILSETLHESSKETELFLESLEKVKSFILSYFTGIWSLMLVMAYYAGSLIHARRSKRDLKHRLFRLPYFIVYFLIFMLVLFFFPITRQISINLFFIIAPFFLIQGFAIIDFFWGKTFTKRRIFLYLMLIALILNPYLLILVLIAGLFDLWFNFRKINIVEETDEDHLD